jgi:hypothetical protein
MYKSLANSPSCPTHQANGCAASTRANIATVRDEANVQSQQKYFLFSEGQPSGRPSLFLGPNR